MLSYNFLLELMSVPVLFIIPSSLEAYLVPLLIHSWLCLVSPFSIALLIAFSLSVRLSGNWLIHSLYSAIALIETTYRSE